MARVIDDVRLWITMTLRKLGETCACDAKRKVIPENRSARFVFGRNDTAGCLSGSSAMSGRYLRHEIVDEENEKC